MLLLIAVNMVDEWLQYATTYLRMAYFCVLKATTADARSETRSYCATVKIN